MLGTAGGELDRLGQGSSWAAASVHMSLSRVEAYYSGRVQGVGFRYTVKSLATGYEVVGTVRNLPDGRVELVAEGDQQELEEFLRAIAESELGHFIREREVSWSVGQGGMKGFAIAG